MNCHVCNSKMNTIETRQVQNHVRRRRECPKCRARLTTYEHATNLLEWLENENERYQQALEFYAAGEQDMGYRARTELERR